MPYFFYSMKTVLKFKTTCTVNFDNENHDQLIYTQQLISLKVIL